MIWFRMVGLIFRWISCKGRRSGLRLVGRGALAEGGSGCLFGGVVIAKVSL